jgi:peptidoglycan/LPS O-acetylase OafA/YrhL
MQKRRGAVIPGLLLMVIGGWLLAQNLGVDLPGIGSLWPAIILVFGLSFLAQYFAGGRTEHGLVFTGVLGSLLGGFFLAITVGPLSWGDLGRYWPVFVLIAGLAFLAQWLARPADRGLLVPAGLALAVGSVALLLNVGAVQPEVAAQVTRLWPVLLILAGLLLLLSYARRPGGSA